MINPNVDVEVTLVKSSKSKSPKRAKNPNLISSNSSSHHNTNNSGGGLQKSQVVPPPPPSLSPPNAPIKFTLLNRLSLISKLVENNDDLVLNCVQLVNFFEFYFNDNNSLNQEENTDYNSTKSQCHANVKMESF